MYLSKNGFVIKKEQFTQDELAEIKRELVCTPISDERYSFGKGGNSYPIYTETQTKLYIPKIYGLKRFGKISKFLPNYIGKRWENDIPFCGELYEHQLEPANLLYNECKNGIGGGILQMITGQGKTITTLNVLSRLRTKTIIVVNKIPLMRQWEREIQQFLPQARIGFIQGQKNVKIEDTDIIIAMLQSLAKIDYPPSFFEDISTVVIDEVHNTSSRVFSKVLSKLCCKYTIGLSATPKRSDGCEYVFQWHLGDIIYKSEVKRNGLAPIVKLVKLKSEHYKEISTVNKMTGQNQIMYSSMINDLIAMTARNEYIIKNIIECMSQKRVMLVLSDRRNHLTTLYKLLEQKGVTFTFGLFLGQMNSKKLEISMGCDVILATYSAFAEGVSKRDLDTVLLATPKKYIGHLKNSVKNESGKMEQIVGRIFRKEHTERNPLIIDLCDDFSVYRNQSAQRKTFYKSHFTDYQLVRISVDLDTQKEIIVEKEPVNKQDEDLSKQFNNICLIED